MADILRLERRAQAPIIDFTNMELGRIKSLENQILKFGLKIGDFFRNPKGAVKAATAAATAAVPLLPPPLATQNMFQVQPLAPVGISGFYKVTGPTEATFYSVTDWPLAPVGSGWIIDSLSGLRGQLIVTAVKNEKGKAEEDYLWSFTFQSDMDQSITEPVTFVTTAALYPPGRLAIKRSGPIYGYYEVLKHVPKFYFSTPPPVGTQAKWIIEGLPTLSGPQKILEFNKDIPERVVNKEKSQLIEVLVTTAVLQAIDGTIPEDSAPVTVKGFPAIIHEPDAKIEYTPGRFLIRPEGGAAIQVPANLQFGNAAPLRDLNDVGLF